MLERIITACLQRKGLIIFAIFLLAALGTWSLLRLPIDAFPDVTNIQVDVMCEAPGLSALEIERFVTQPVEIAMRGLPGIEQMRSVTKYGLSVVTLVFKDDVDMYFARRLVFERLGSVTEKIPVGSKVEMGPVATAMGEVYQFTLSGSIPADPKEQIRYFTELRTLVEWVINPLLKAVPGVSEVNSFGGYFKQYEVTVSPEMLLKYDLTLEDVTGAIGKNNQNVGGNTIDRYSEQCIVRGIGLLQTEDDIRNIVLKTVETAPIYVKDVATVAVGEAVRQGASLINGHDEAVGGIVMMLRDENSSEVVERIKARVREINENNILPHGIRISPYYDRTDIISTSIGTVTGALRDGSILVLIILYLFLRNFRSAFVVILALPLSLLLTFTVMKNVGLSANLMSLGGLAISIGMIIDATIIQVENVQRHLLSGNPDRKLTTVLRAVLEVRKPSILGELIIAVTFLPILSLEGLEGKMFTPLALTVAIAVFSSLLISIFVIPVLSLIFLKQHDEKESFVMRYAKKLYFPLLEWSLRKKATIIGIATVLVLASFVLLPNLGTEFIPVMDEGAFDMDVQLLPGTTLAKAMETNRLIGDKLMKFSELKTIVSRTGQTGIALEARGIDKTGYAGIFLPRSEWVNADTREELMELMRDSLASIPGIVFSFSQPIQCRIDELVAGTRAQLLIKLFGNDTEILKAKAQEIGDVLASVRGATDIIVEQVAGQPYLSIQVDRAKVARHGLNVADVLGVVEIAIGGKAATQMYEDNKVFDVVVRYPEEKRNSVETIGNILVPTSHGYKVPLNQVAEVQVQNGPVQVSRDNGLRRIGIELNIADRDIGSFVEEAKAEIRKKVPLAAGYFTEWGGQFENQQRATNRLLIIAPLAIGLIVFFLFLTFRSFRLTFLVIFNLPFALIGGVFALFISGLYLSVPASIGFIVLFGVAVLNGTVLVSHITELQKGGLDVLQAVRTGCADRLRPVLMTASISIFSLLPMLFATGPGSEIQKPLATVVVGGLLTSTFLTLVLVPTLYLLSEKVARRFGIS